MCDVFVMLSRKLANGDLEGLGLVLLEARACGKPVIAGNSGGTSEALEQENANYLVDAENMEQVLAVSEQLIREKNE